MTQTGPARSKKVSTPVPPGSATVLVEFFGPTGLR
jgi:hypothetical protein